MSAPDRVFMDPRVAARLPVTAADAAEHTAQGSAEAVGYVREDWHKARLREASTLGDEFVVQIASRENDRQLDRLVVLTNFGRIFIEVTGGWREFAPPSLEP